MDRGTLAYLVMFALIMLLAIVALAL